MPLTTGPQKRFNERWKLGEWPSLTMGRVDSSIIIDIIPMTKLTNCSFECRRIWGSPVRRPGSGVQAFTLANPAIGVEYQVYGTPWQGDPRVNIQNKKGKARPIRFRQVLRAIES
jgi:hypothetical protein